MIAYFPLFIVLGLFVYWWEFVRPAYLRKLAVYKRDRQRLEELRRFNNRELVKELGENYHVSYSDLIPIGKQFNDNISLNSEENWKGERLFIDYFGKNSLDEKLAHLNQVSLVFWAGCRLNKATYRQIIANKKTSYCRYEALLGFVKKQREEKSLEIDDQRIIDHALSSGFFYGFSNNSNVLLKEDYDVIEKAENRKFDFDQKFEKSLVSAIDSRYERADKSEFYFELFFLGVVFLLAFGYLIQALIPKETLDYVTNRKPTSNAKRISYFVKVLPFWGIGLLSSILIFRAIYRRRIWYEGLGRSLYSLGLFISGFALIGFTGAGAYSAYKLITLPKSLAYGYESSSDLKYGVVEFDRTVNWHGKESVDVSRIKEFDGNDDISDANGRHLIFVHGFKTSFESAAIACREFKVKLRFPGKVTLFSWPSWGEVEMYNRDRTNVDLSVKPFEQYLRNLLLDEDTQEVVLVSYSLGNDLALNGVHKLGPEFKHKLRLMVLLAPDVDARWFDRVLGPAAIANAHRVIVYQADDDVPLMGSSIINGGTRVGELKYKPSPSLDLILVNASDYFMKTGGHDYYLHDVIVGSVARQIELALTDRFYRNDREPLKMPLIIETSSKEERPSYPNRASGRFK